MDRYVARLAVILLIGLQAAVYLPLRQAPFVYEDPHYFRAPAVWALPGRGLSVASLLAVDGFDAEGAHLGNVALHLVNGALVYAVASALMTPAVGVASAWVFLAHPLNSEAVSYVTARADLLLTGAILCAIWGAVRWSEGGGAGWIVGSTLALGVAAFSKEIGLVAVPLVAITLGAWRPQWARTCLWALVALIAAAVGAAVLAPRLSAFFRLGTSAVGFHWRAWLELQATATAQMLSFIVWPAGRLSVDHDVLPLVATWGLPALLLLALVGGIAVVTWLAWPLVSWAAAWLLVSLAPRFVFAAADPLHEYQFYLPMVGVSLLLGAGLVTLAEWFSGKDGTYATV